MASPRFRNIIISYVNEQTAQLYQRYLLLFQKLY